MAEAATTPTTDESSNKDKGDEADDLECAVCLQTCIHPAKLPCGHVFCFLCIKGIANQSKRCAMCRQEIPRDFIDQPNLLPATDATDVQTEDHDGGYQWFYEGRNGWWQYDERTSKELETSYKAGDRTCELLIAGFLYVTDLEAMLQLRRNDPSRRRRIKRDLATIPKKGIAGLRIDADLSTVAAPLSEDELTAQIPSNVNEPMTQQRHNDTSDSHVPSATPTNTPQSPTSGRTSPDHITTDHYLRVTMDRIRALRVDDVGAATGAQRVTGRLSREGVEADD